MTTRHDHSPPPRCELCDGTGWTDCLDDRRHRPTCLTPADCTCHAVVPCRCSRGRHADNVHARVLNANGHPALPTGTAPPPDLFGS